MHYRYGKQGEDIMFVQETAYIMILTKGGLLEKCSHTLVLMYATCGEFGKAKELLNMHMHRNNVVTWSW